MYTIKEIYKTIQGEGAQAGRTAVFVRFTGCNLWTGKEKHREHSVCQFCDTDFVGTNGINGGTYSAIDLAMKINAIWGGADNKLIVFTGGEPMLQLDKDLIEICRASNFETAIETNGTIEIDFAIDWICVSPKSGSVLKVFKGNELKVVFPQEELKLDQLQNLIFDHYFLQPMDSEKSEQNTLDTINYCKSNPKWKLSLQQHKLLGIP